jgi:hypothetical protein
MFHLLKEEDIKNITIAQAYVDREIAGFLLCAVPCLLHFRFTLLDILPSSEATNYQ